MIFFFHFFIRPMDIHAEIITFAKFGFIDATLPFKKLSLFGQHNVERAQPLQLES